MREERNSDDAAVAEAFGDRRAVKRGPAALVRCCDWRCTGVDVKCTLHPCCHLRMSRLRVFPFVCIDTFARLSPKCP